MADEHRTLSEWLFYVAESLGGTDGLAARVDILNRICGLEDSRESTIALRALFDHERAPDEIMAMAVVGGIMMIRCSAEKELENALSEFSDAPGPDSCAHLVAAQIFNDQDDCDDDDLQ